MKKKLIRQGVFAKNEFLPCHRANNITKKPKAIRLSMKTARLITDLRKINSIMRGSPHGALPNIETIRESLIGYDYLTKLDLKDAFFSIQVRHSDTYKLATTGEDEPCGLRYMQVPMPLCHSNSD